MGRIKQCYYTLDKAQDAVQHISPFICWHCDRPVSDSIQHHEYKATDVEIRDPLSIKMMKDPDKETRSIIRSDAGRPGNLNIKWKFWAREWNYDGL